MTKVVVRTRLKRHQKGDVYLCKYYFHGKDISTIYAFDLHISIFFKIYKHIRRYALQSSESDPRESVHTPSS